MSRASGVGSWPDTDVGRALSEVRDLLSEDGLPYLPELPARGPGADMIGRGAGLLVDLKVDLQPMGWRFVDRPGRDAHRTSSLLRQDLDELAEAFDDYEGDLKVQIAGPWTLASSIWLHRGERAVVDVGATRDLIASLAEGLRVHLVELARLVPGANLVVQIDEPGLTAVLAGELPTASGFGRIRAVDPTIAAEGLRDVVAAAGDRHTV
ncbi:MAG: methionine synthase, partial [Dermatophilaceae bacterium]